MNNDDAERLEHWCDGSLDDAQASTWASELCSAPQRRAELRRQAALLLILRCRLDQQAPACTATAVRALLRRERASCRAATTPLVRLRLRRLRRLRVVRRLAWAAGIFIFLGITAGVVAMRHASPQSVALPIAAGTAHLELDAGAMASVDGLTAATGQKLAAGSHVLIERGQARVRWADADMSLVAHSAAIIGGRPRLELLAGAVDCAVAHQDPATPVAVSTPDGQLVVVGTAFTAQLDATGTQVTVRNGTVMLHGGDGASRPVSAGSSAHLPRAPDVRPPLFTMPLEFAEENAPAWLRSSDWKMSPGASPTMLACSTTRESPLFVPLPTGHMVCDLIIRGTWRSKVAESSFLDLVMCPVPGRLAGRSIILSGSTVAVRQRLRAWTWTNPSPNEVRFAVPGPSYHFELRCSWDGTGLRLRGRMTGNGPGEPLLFDHAVPGPDSPPAGLALVAQNWDGNIDGLVVESR